MSISVGGLRSLCDTKVVELKFKRRTKGVVPPTRRMFCTTNYALLNSVFGREILKFKKPKHPPHFSPNARGLVTVWDILMQDWRNVPVETCDVISAVPLYPLKDFLVYFDKSIRPMTDQEKEKFMKK
jgi:hypothetical protein